jgi:hypothetical protein
MICRASGKETARSLVLRRVEVDRIRHDLEGRYLEGRKELRELGERRFRQSVRA